MGRWWRPSDTTLHVDAKPQGCCNCFNCALTQALVCSPRRRCQPVARVHWYARQSAKALFCGRHCQSLREPMFLNTVLLRCPLRVVKVFLHKVLTLRNCKSKGAE